MTDTLVDLRTVNLSTQDVPLIRVVEYPNGIGMTKIPSELLKEYKLALDALARAQTAITGYMELTNQHDRIPYWLRTSGALKFDTGEWMVVDRSEGDTIRLCEELECILYEHGPDIDHLTKDGVRYTDTPEQPKVDLYQVLSQPVEPQHRHDSARGRFDVADMSGVVVPQYMLEDMKPDLLAVAMNDLANERVVFNTDGAVVHSLLVDDANFAGVSVDEAAVAVVNHDPTVWDDAPLDLDLDTPIGVVNPVPDVVEGPLPRYKRKPRLRRANGDKPNR